MFRAPATEAGETLVACQSEPCSRRVVEELDAARFLVLV